MSIAAHLLDSYGYLAVAGGVGLESVGLPLPGETILIAAASYAGATRHLSTLVVVIVAAAAGIVGDNIGYWLGRGFGGRLLGYLHHRIDRRTAQLGRIEALFDKHSGRVVFLGRFVSVVRTYAAFLAGARRMAWRRFLVFNTLGVISWASIIGFGSAVLGSSIGVVGSYGLTAGIVVAVFAVALWRRRSHNRHAADIAAVLQ